MGKLQDAWEKEQQHSFSLFQLSLALRRELLIPIEQSRRVLRGYVVSERCGSEGGERVYITNRLPSEIGQGETIYCEWTQTRQQSGENKVTVTIGDSTTEVQNVRASLMQGFSNYVLPEYITPP